MGRRSTTPPWPDRSRSGRHSGSHGGGGGGSRSRYALGVALAASVLTVAALIVIDPAASAVVPASAHVDGSPAVAGIAAVGGQVIHPQDPSGSAATTVGHGHRRHTLVVTPAAGLSPYGDEIVIRGAGFDPRNDLWVAVCEDDGVAPQAFLHCLGGPIPDANATSSWGVVTSSGRSPYAGPAAADWHAHGTFELRLELLAAQGQDADCLARSCSVYTRSARDEDRSQDTHVRFEFASPSDGQSTSSRPTHSRRTSVAQSTETVHGAPATPVTPETVLETSVVPGAEQKVIFADFVPGEKVDVTLYSDPITLPTAKADSDGQVTISFTVPDDVPVGEHIIQAVGRTSGQVGVASFSVGAAETTETTETTETIETDAAPPTTDEAMADGVAGSGTLPAGTDAGGMAADSAPMDVESLAQPNQPAQPVQATPISMTESSTTALAAAGGSDGSRMWWLWVVLAVLVLVGGAAGVVILVRRRRDYGDDPESRDYRDDPGNGAGGRHSAE